MNTDKNGIPIFQATRRQPHPLTKKREPKQRAPRPVVHEPLITLPGGHSAKFVTNIANRGDLYAIISPAGVELKRQLVPVCRDRTRFLIGIIRGGL